jgi:uncharacterized repeat protein (TIGR03803 family)
MRPSRFFAVVFALSALLLVLVSRSKAQTVITVYSFTGQHSSGLPYLVTPVQGRDGRLYGTTFGPSGTCGTAFKMATGGQAATIYTFGADGCNPEGGLTLATDGNFYGVTLYGGSSNYGVIFKLTSEGAYTVLHEFAGGSDGSGPIAPPIEASDGNLYGATAGTDGNLPTIYKYTLKGAAYSTIYNFTASSGEAVEGPLTQGSNGSLYGAASLGGTDFGGALFEVTTTGTLLWSYDFIPSAPGGATPYSLTQASNGNFYGAAISGGAQDVPCGTIFDLGPTGSVSTLYTFKGFADGCGPETALTLGTDGNFYGISPYGGAHNGGTLFRISQSGVFDLLNTFGVNGNTPLAAPVQDTNGIFYGTTQLGGKYDSGAVYSYNAGLDPFIALVVPAGMVGQSAQILGQSLTNATGVAFNGVAATSFSVKSDTFMTAVVPSGATTGPVVVTTPGGALSSNVSFRIIE